jgi:hypothetical protein
MALTWCFIPGQSIFHVLCGRWCDPRVIYRHARPRCHRLGYDERTRAYASRRTTEGKTKREIIRCLKRYLAREVFTALLGSPSIAAMVPAGIASCPGLDP